MDSKQYIKKKYTTKPKEGYTNLSCDICGDRGYVGDCDTICDKCYKSNGCWDKMNGNQYTAKMAKLSK